MRLFYYMYKLLRPYRLFITDIAQLVGYPYSCAY